MFAVRITRSFDELKPFFDKVISKHPDSVLVVYQHDADDQISRTHIHALMENVNPSTDTLKRWVKEALGVTQFSRYDWAFPVAEDRNFITYMSKGKLEPMLIFNISPEEVTEFRAKWVEYVETPTPKDKREEVTSYMMSEELAKWMDMDVRDVQYDPVKRSWIKHGEDITEYDIVEKCIQIHNKYRKGYCDFSLVRVVQTAYGLCSKVRFKQALINKVLEKLSPKIV